MDVDSLISDTRSFTDDLQKLKLYWETNCQWEARKKILSNNWKKYENKDKLISLSCAWSNVKYNGNRYSDKVMSSLNELEKGLGLYDKKKVKSNDSLTTMKRTADLPEVYDTKKLPKNCPKICFVKSAETGNDNFVQKHVKMQTKSHFNNDECHSDQKNHCKLQKISTHRSSTNVKKLTDEFHQDLTLQCSDSLCKVEKNKIISPATSSQLANMLMKCSSKLKNISYTQSTPGHLLISTFSKLADQFSMKLQLLCEYLSDEHIPLYEFWKKNSFCNELHDCLWICDVYLDTAFICQEYGRTKKISKTKAIKKAIHILSGSYYVTTGSRLISITKSVQQLIIQDVASSNNYPPLLTSKKAPILKKNQFMETNFPPGKKTIQGKAAVKNLKTATEKNAHVNTFVSLKSPMRRESEFLARKSLPNQSKPPQKEKIAPSWNNSSPSIDYSFVVVCFPNHSSIETLRTSASMSKALLDVKKTVNGNEISYDITLNSRHIASGAGSTQSIALESAANKALEILKKTYLVLIKTRQLGDLSKAVSLDFKKESETLHSEAIPEDNIGNRLLRKMGWSGSGGLGVDKNGISEPIATEHFQEPCDRSGLGRKNVEVIPYRLAKKALQDYVRNGCVDEVTFSPDLTKLQRKEIHLMAKRMGLHSQSYGSVDRHLVVYKKLSVSEIAKRLAQTGGELNGYVLASS